MAVGSHPPVTSNRSKAQQILGLSRAELDNVQNPITEIELDRPISNNYDQESFRSFFSNPRSKALAAGLREAGVQKASTSIKASSEQTSEPNRPNQDTVLNTLATSPAARSYNESANLSSKAAHQTSHSASQDYILRSSKSGTPKASSNEIEQSEQSKQYRLFRSVKPPNEDHNRNVNIKRFPIRPRSTSLRRPTNVDAIVSISSVITPISAEKISSPTYPQGIAYTDHAKNRFFAKDQDDPPAAERKKHMKNAADNVLSDPCAKVNVRRPKVGTKHWFDDMGLSSEDEDNLVDNEQNCTMQGKDNQQFSIEDAQECQEKQFLTEDTVMESRSVQPLSNSSNQTELQSQNIDDMLISRPLDPDLEADHTSRIEHHISSISGMVGCEVDIKQYRDEANSKLVDDVNADDDGEMAAVLSPIRESLAIDRYAHSDYEIHLAQAIIPQSSRSGSRPSQVEVSSRRSPPVTPSEDANDAGEFGRGSDDVVAPLQVEVEAKDEEEDILLDSFPATPQNTRLQRISSRSSNSSLEDERSIRSMRLMKVTRQEEKLIAAMRMKRASMKRHERETSIYRLSPNYQSIPDAMNSGENPVHSYRSSRTSGFVDETLADQVRAAGTSVDGGPSRGRHRSVPAALETSRLLERLEISRPLYTTKQPPLQPLSLSTTGEALLRAAYTVPSPMSAESIAHPPTPQFASSQSENGYTRDIIVMDNLQAAVPSRNMPAQLYLESPFTFWEHDREKAALKV